MYDYLRSERGKDNCIYVLHMQDGRMMSETSWRHMWTSYMKDLDISCNAERSNRQIIGVQTEPFTPHQLRHTFATNCYLAGVDAQTCMEWMGHSNVETTLGIYTHISKKHKKQVVNKLDAYYADNQLISV